MAVSLRHTTPISATFAGGNVGFTECYLTVSSDIALQPLTVPPVRAYAQCDAIIGGTSGFTATVNGTINTATGAAELDVHHPGGWAPVSAFASRFTSPAFDGSLDINVGGQAVTFIGIVSDIDFDPAIDLGDGLSVALTSHPNWGIASAGPAVSVRLSMATLQSDPTFSLRLVSGVRIGEGGPNGFPLIGLEGQVDSSGVSTLQVTTATHWTPLADLPSFRVPPLVGTFTLNGPADTLEVSLTHTAPIDISAANGLISFTNGQVDVQITGSTLVGGARSLATQFSGSAQIGGTNGFAATASGNIDTAAESMSLTVSHDGGWSPLGGGFASVLTTPAFTGTLDINVGSIAVAFSGTAVFVNDVDLIPGVAALVADPTVAPEGPSIELNLVQTDAGTATSFDVTIASGLRIGGDSSFAPPLFSITGTLDSTGTSTLTMSTASPWTPVSAVPALSVPALAGSVSLNVPDDNMVIFVENTSPISVDLGSNLASLQDWYVNIAATIGLSDTSLAALNPTVRTGTISIGALNNLQASIEGSVSLPEGSATITLLPVTNWSPLPGDFAQYFTIPSFGGTLHLGVGGNALRFVGSATMPTFELGVATLSSHPALGLEGPLIDVDLTAATFSGTPDVDIRLQSGLQLGGAHGPPTFAVDGTLNIAGTASISLTMDSPWTPLSALPALQVPAMTGTMDVDIPNNSIDVTVSNLSPLAASLANAVDMSNCDFTVGAAIDIQALASTGPSALTTTMSCDVSVIPSVSGGFSGTVSGTVDTVEGSVNMVLAHPGGWEPVQGPFADLFTTPAIDGTLAVNVGGVPLAVTGTATYAGAIALLDDVATITPGLVLTVDVNQASTGAAITTRVGLAGGVQLGPAGDLPELVATGNISTATGTTWLGLATATPWTPVPTLLPTLDVPRLYGELTIEANGALSGFATHDPASEIKPFDVVGLDLMQIGTRFSTAVGGGGGGTGGGGGRGRSLKEDIEEARQDARRQMQAFGLTMNGEVELGGDDGFLSTAVGSIQKFAGGETVSLTLDHPGGVWKPFVGLLDDFYAPAFTGDFAWRSAPAAGTPRLFAQGRVELANELSLLPAGSPVSLSLAKASTTPDAGFAGPIFFGGVTQLVGGPASFDVGMIGRVCVALSPGAPTCLDVNASATNAPPSFSLSSRYVGGDISPLSVVLGPVNLGDAIILHATDARPMTVSLTAAASPASLGFNLAGKMTISLSGIGIDLGATTFDFVAIGSVGGPGGFKGAYVASVTSLSLPVIGNIVDPANPVIVGIATDAGLPAVAIAGRDIALSQGLQIILTASAGDPIAICPDAMEGRLAVSVGAAGRSVSMRLSCVGFDLRVLNRYRNDLFLLPSINYLSMNGISVAAEITPQDVAFSLNGLFTLETGSPGNNACSSGTSSACMRATLEASAATHPAGADISLSLFTSGAWIEPLALRNFAVTDPRFGTSVIVSPSAPWLISIGAIFLDLSVYWKSSGDWPASMTDINSWGPQCASCNTWNLPCTCYASSPSCPATIDYPCQGPADLSSEGDLRLFVLQILFEAPPHDDITLGPLPKFGVRIVIPEMGLREVIQMANDVSASMITLAHASAANAARIAGETVPALPEIPDVQLPTFLDAIFPFRFSITAELSLVDDTRFSPPLERGILIDAAVSAHNFLGLSFQLGATLVFRPPSLTEFASNPLSILTSAGMGLRASATLPFGIGAVDFDGFVSPTVFSLSASCQLGIGPISFAISLGIAYEAPANLALSFNGPLPLPGPFGIVQVNGRMTTQPWDFELEASYIRGLFGFTTCGYIFASSDPAVVQVNGSSSWGFLGRVSFFGRLEGTSRIQMSATISVTSLSSIVNGIVDTITSIFGGICTACDSGLNLIADALGQVFAAIPLTLVRASASYDSSGSGLPMSLTMSIFGSEKTLGFNLPVPVGGRMRELEAASGRRALQASDCAANAMTVSDLVGKFADTFSDIATMIANICDVDNNVCFDETFAFSGASGLLDSGIDGSLRVRMQANPPLPTLTLAVGFDFLGAIAVSGSLTLGIRGGIEAGHLRGTGTLAAPCPGCPSLTGSVNLEKTLTSVSLQMAAAFSFAGVSVAGDVHFSTDGGIRSFSITGSGSIGCSGCPSLTGSVSLAKTEAGVVTLGMAASFSFAGIAVSGNVGLSSSGGVLNFELTGTGSIGISGCSLCPSMSGSATLRKQGSALTFSATASASLAGISVSGSAAFSSNGGVTSFSLTGDASSIGSTLFDGIIKTFSGGSLNNNNIIVRGMRLITFSFGSATFAYSGSSISVTLSLSIAGVSKSFSFTTGTLPRTASDLADVLLGLGSQLKTMLSPLDINIPLSLPGSGSRVCTPRICFAPTCSFSRRQLLDPDGDGIVDNATLAGMATVVPLESELLEQPQPEVVDKPKVIEFRPQLADIPRLHEHTPRPVTAADIRPQVARPETDAGGIADEDPSGWANRLMKLQASWMMDSGSDEAAAPPPAPRLHQHTPNIVPLPGGKGVATASLADGIGIEPPRLHQHTPQPRQQALPLVTAEVAATAADTNWSGYNGGNASDNVSDNATWSWPAAGHDYSPEKPPLSHAHTPMHDTRQLWHGHGPVHAHVPHRYRPHAHVPHAHHPHGHLPHAHHPHTHRPHVHVPHAHHPHTHRPHVHLPHLHHPHTHRPHVHLPHLHHPHTHRPHIHVPHVHVPHIHVPVPRCSFDSSCAELCIPVPTLSATARLRISTSSLRVEVSVTIRAGAVNSIAGVSLPVGFPGINVQESVSFTAGTSLTLCDVIPSNFNLGTLGGGRLSITYRGVGFNGPSIPSIALSVGSLFPCASLF
jgi:hypothetical protein